MVSQSVVGCVGLLFKGAKHSSRTRRVVRLLALVLVTLVSQRSLSAQLTQSNGKVIFAAPATSVGTSSAPQNLLLKTTSAISITSFTVPLSQGSKQEYTVGAVTGCTVDGTTVNPSGTTCTVPITFTPAYPGTRAVPLRIVTSGGNVNIGLAGSGVSPLAAITPGIISTIAGDVNASGCAAYNGPATQGPQCNPSGVAVDAAGNVYIVSFYSNTVSKIDPSGNVTVIAGTGAGGVSGANGPATEANIERPADVVIDPAGNVYFADESAQQVFRIDAVTQILTSVAGNGTQGYSGDNGPATAAEMNRPEGVALDLQGNLYIEDQDNNIIRKVDTAGVITTVAGDPTTAGNGDPTYGGDGGPAIKAGLALCCSGVAASYDSIGVDASGNLFIGDSGHHVIREVTTDGIIHTVAGNNALGAGFSGDGGAATSAQLNEPMGVAVDPAGDIYIADFFNNRIRKVDAATQIISTVAGNGNGTFAGDGGPATLASLNGPQKVELDGLGNLYIGDTKNYLVRKVTDIGPTLTFITPTLDGTTDTTDGPLGVIVSNIGNAPLTLDKPSSGSNPTISANFSLFTGETGACPTLNSSSASATIAEGASCALDVNFTPLAAGSLTGSLVLTDNSLNTSSPAASQTISYAGTGTAAAVASLAPTSLSFPSTTIAVTSAAMTTKLSNTGTATLNISGITITGTNAANFGETSTCTATLAAGSNCVISVTFTPSATGAATATLNVADDAAGSPQTVALAGTGTGGVSVSPSSIDFGDETENTYSFNPVKVTIVNNSNSPVTLGTLAFSKYFGLYQDDCGGVAPANSSSCYYLVDFYPATVGPQTGTLTIPYTGAGGGTLTVSLQGNGTAGTPLLSINPPYANFPTALVMTAAEPVVLQIDNTGTAATTAITTTITGANASDFTETNNCTTLPEGSSGFGSSCNVTVSFMPTAAGPRNATVTVSANGADGGSSTATAPLTGAGVAALPQLQFTPAQLNLFAGAGGPCSDATAGGLATAATLCNITGTTQDDLGNTYLVDNTYNAVYKVDTTGKISIFAGTPSKAGGYTGDGSAATSATLSGPTAVASDAFGNVYLSDTANGVIRVVDPTGVINTFVSGECEDDGAGTPKGRRPAGILARIGHRHALDLCSTLKPEGLVVDTSGNLIWADPKNNAVFTLNVATNVFGLIAGDPPNIYSFQGAAGYNGDNIASNTAELNAPKDVAVDSAGNIYIADTLNYRIRKVTIATDIITTVAGNGTQGDTGDGAAATAAEINPYGVASNLAGDLFITPNTGGIVRKVDATGTINIFAGGGTGALGGVASTGAVANAYFARTDNSGDLLIPTGSQVLSAGPNGLLQFGSEPIGTTSSAQIVTLESTGDSFLQLGTVVGNITGTDAADFALTGGNCGYTLHPGSTCTAEVTFKPSATGARTASLSIPTNAAGSPQIVLLQGNGSAAAAPTASLSPTALSFPNTAVGSTAAAISTTLSNTGNAVLNVSGITITGANPTDFAETTTCGATLAAGATCTISVTFTPAAVASYTASISVADNATGSPQTATLSGTGTATPAPVASLSPTALSFPNTAVGSSAAAISATLSNTGNTVLNISGITITGTNPADFADTTTCGATLAAGATCTISATFTPAAVASYTATISVADNATGSPQTANLSGTGTAAPAPIASLSPTALAFPATTAGSTATALSTTLSNTGNAPMTITGITLAGANPADFAETTTCGVTLAAGATCTIAATFTPTAAGTFTASITVADNATGSPQTATLTGTGNAAPATDFNLAATPPALTVAPGGIASFTITTSGVGGPFDSAIQLTATGLPSGYSATFAPPSVTPGPSGASSVLSIQTTPLSALAQPHPLRRTPRLPVTLAVLLLVPLLGLRKRFRKLRGVSVCLMLLGMLVPVLMLTGCGGGYYSLQTKSYTVTITGTSGSIQHSTTVTLTVQQ